MKIEHRMLRAICEMPLTDRLDLVGLTGWSRGAAYEGVRRLVDAGFAVSVPHSSPMLPPTRRFLPTVEGIRALAEMERLEPKDTLRLFPVSEEHRRLLMARLDAVALIYRIAAAVSGAAGPIEIRWLRGAPQDADAALPGGRVLRIVRIGRSADRTSTAKRLWRLSEFAGGSASLVVAPDDFRARHTRRLLARSPAIAFVALEEQAAHASADDPVWRMPSAASQVDLRTIVGSVGPAHATEQSAAGGRASQPTPFELDDAGAATPAWQLPVELKPSEKSAVDLLHDWPWISPNHLGLLLGVRRSRTSQIVRRLLELGVARRFRVAGRTALVLSDRGIALVGRRDRVSVGALRKRWSAAGFEGCDHSDWRDAAGSRTRQLLRNIDHTRAVHAFVASFARQARSRSFEIVQIDPPARASRYFRLGAALRSVQPDAYLAVRRGDEIRPFFLEWERRAVRPTTMAARIAPYIRYFSTSAPLDDHGAQPAVLVVFEDRAAQSRFLRIAREEMQREGVRVPLLVSRREMTDEKGPLGPIWRSADGGRLRPPSNVV